MYRLFPRPNLDTGKKSAGRAGGREEERSMIEETTGRLDFGTLEAVGYQRASLGSLLITDS
jgi:hypothetical protein